MLLCFVFGTTLLAQNKLVFTNTYSGKIVIVKTNDILKLVYHGYLGQIEQVYGKVEMISDSLLRFDNNRHVRVADIIGFRRFSKYHEIAKNSVQIVTLICAIVVVPLVLANNPGFGLWTKVGIGFGFGGGVALLNNGLFSENIKNYMIAGWVVKVE